MRRLESIIRWGLPDLQSVLLREFPHQCATRGNREGFSPWACLDSNVTTFCNDDIADHSQTVHPLETN